VALRARDALGAAHDAHGARHLAPVEHEGAVGVRGELLALAGGVVGVEEEAAGVEGLEEDDAGGGEACGGGGGEGHGLGLGDGVGDGFGEPEVELVERGGEDAARGQSIGGIVLGVWEDVDGGGCLGDYCVHCEAATTGRPRWDAGGAD
jgi:hypothetical protein